MTLRVKDTNLINLRPCDILMYRAGSLLWPDWDILGGLISGLEGNKGTSRDPNAPGLSKGDYTHCAWVRDIPDPEAEVEEVSDRPGVFKIKDGQTWLERVELPSPWCDEQQFADRLRCKMGVRVHATWPCVKEESIDWENPHMEVWRLRRLTPEIADGIIKLANDSIGFQYDIAEFLTFGAVHLPSSKICSEFISDLAYYASMLRGNGAPILCTPDLRGNRDCEKTPNDIINSEELVKVRFQGLLSQ